MNEDGKARDTLIGIVLLTVLVLAATSLGAISGLRWYLSPENELSIVQRKDLVQGLASAGQALAVFPTGAVGLFGLFFTWQGIVQTRRSTQRTLELTEQGQITERFTRAIEQLGMGDERNKNLEVRLGGIYALERISRESKEDEQSINEILSAYVRHHASRSPNGSQRTYDELLDQRLDSDIQAILDIIGRRKQRFDPEIGERIDLNRTSLHRGTFYGGNFSGVFFFKAELRVAFFDNADLSNAIFDGANLEGASFLGANLDGADFENVNLEGVQLTQSQIDQAIGNENTIHPEHLQRPIHWPEKLDEQANEP